MRSWFFNFNFHSALEDVTTTLLSTVGVLTGKTLVCGSEEEADSLGLFFDPLGRPRRGGRLFKAKTVVEVPDEAVIGFSVDPILANFIDPAELLPLTTTYWKGAVPIKGGG